MKKREILNKVSEYLIDNSYLLKRLPDKSDFYAVYNKEKKDNIKIYQGNIVDLLCNLVKKESLSLYDLEFKEIEIRKGNFCINDSNLKPNEFNPMKYTIEKVLESSDNQILKDYKTFFDYLRIKEKEVCLKRLSRSFDKKTINYLKRKVL
jgi:hypothetical protein